jgi:uncharacterized membrane protein
LLDLAIASIPVAVVSILLAAIVYYIRDRKMLKKYYGNVSSDNIANDKKQEEGT